MTSNQNQQLFGTADDDEDLHETTNSHNYQMVANQMVAPYGSDRKQLFGREEENDDEDDDDDMLDFDAEA